MADTDSNNALYFIVGGLVVVALGFGFFFFNPDMINMSGSAPQTSNVGQTDVKINENGASITHTESK